MNLLTKEQALALKPGDLVNVYHFSPRKSKDLPEPEKVHWQGRDQWVESVWRNEVVDSVPVVATHEEDGVLLKLKRGATMWNGLRMERAEF